MSHVEVRNIHRFYGDFVAVNDANFSIAKGEFFSLLGPSGCGKTTTLRMIAGFVAPSRGQILLQGEDVTRTPPERRGIGLVFQNYAIFPHMTVAKNIGYGLRLRRCPKDEIARKVHEALAQVGLEGYEDRTPDQLSGGEQQRVALARVIVLEPRLLLLDEPLSALDKRLRDEMRVWLKQLQHELGITTVYVTHDQDEALSLSDRIAVMNRGVVQQIGAPSEIYERPRNQFVADFIGESNLIPVTVRAVSPQGLALAFGDGLTCEAGGAGAPSGLAVGLRLFLMVRPEQVGVETGDRGAGNRYPGKVESVSYHGSVVRFTVSLPGGVTVRADVANLGAGGPLPAVGDRVHVGWDRNHSVLVPA